MVKRIQDRLPKLFYIAELESSRAGKVGMEVGSMREKIIIALLIYKFGESNVNVDFPITAPEIDVEVFNNPISIKTITKSLSGIKLIWTVDAKQALNFRENYFPKYDMLFVHINWNNKGLFCFIPASVQKSVFNRIGRERYIKLPKPGTNPRGAEMTSEAIKNLISNNETLKIDIDWVKEAREFSPYKRWVDLWRQENI